MSRSRPADTVDVLLVCTGGGHLLQLWSLREAWPEFARAWVVAGHDGSDVESLLAGERVYSAYAPACRSVKNLVRNLVLAQRLLRRLRPKAIVTTGAAVAVPFAWMARARGIPVVWVETLARADRPSLSCRLAAPVADRIYVQWPELLPALPRARYAGTVFS
jgi:beta-1,4-N-acetylglucosaminyltransferase